MKQTLFITGPDTGVGKTVLTALLVKFLRGRGVNATMANVPPLARAVLVLLGFNISLMMPNEPQKKRPSY